MKVVDKVEIKNRGTLIIVKEAGKTKISLDGIIKQNEREWKIVGIEIMYNRDTSPDRPFGLLIKPINHTIAAPNLGLIEFISNKIVKINENE